MVEACPDHSQQELEKMAPPSPSEDQVANGVKAIKSFSLSLSLSLQALSPRPNISISISISIYRYGIYTYQIYKQKCIHDKSLGDPMARTQSPALRQELRELRPLHCGCSLQFD